MQRLLQIFDRPFTDGRGDLYDVQLYGQSRPADTWQGWLVFVRQRDGRAFTTDVETTQPSAEAVLYWATGLSDTYFDGAFDRANRRIPESPRPAASTPAPLRDASVDEATYVSRLTSLERAILHAFQRHSLTQLSTQTIFDELPHAHADVVRALEDLEKRSRLLVRRTEGGSDWLILTEAGVDAAGVAGVPHVHGRAEMEPR